jgi:hypothetical protein
MIFFASSGPAFLDSSPKTRDRQLVVAGLAEAAGHRHADRQAVGLAPTAAAFRAGGRAREAATRPTGARRSRPRWRRRPTWEARPAGLDHARSSSSVYPRRGGRGRSPALPRPRSSDQPRGAAAEEVHR